MRQTLRQAVQSRNERAAFLGLRALWNFAFNSNSNQRIALEIVGAPALVRHLRHVNLTVRLRAAGVCWTLTHNQEGRAALIAAGATPASVELFLEAEQLHRADPLRGSWGLIKDTSEF